MQNFYYKSNSLQSNNFLTVMDISCTITSKINGTPQRCQKNYRYLQHSVMKFDRSNKFDFCYYGQVNTFGGNIYFAGDATLGCFMEEIEHYKLFDL